MLEPAPGSSWGWADAPYAVSWSYQLGAFVQGQATRQWQIHMPAGGDVNAFEDVDLYAFQGRPLRGVPPRSLPFPEPSTAGR